MPFTTSALSSAITSPTICRRSVVLLTYLPLQIPSPPQVYWCLHLCYFLQRLFSQSTVPLPEEIGDPVSVHVWCSQFLPSDRTTAPTSPCFIDSSAPTACAKFVSRLARPYDSSLIPDNLLCATVLYRNFFSDCTPLYHLVPRELDRPQYWPNHPTHLPSSPRRVILLSSGPRVRLPSIPPPVPTVSPSGFQSPHP